MSEKSLEEAANELVPNYKSTAGIAYDDASKGYFALRPDDSYWSGVTDGVVRTNLALRGFSPVREKGSMPSEVDRTISTIQAESVSYAGELAGHDKGVFVGDDATVLVTRSAKLPVPEKGEWNTIQRVLEGLFSGPDALAHFYGWLKVAVEARMAGVLIPGQACVFAGPAGCGKSLIQHQVITPLLGGRCCKPMQYLLGKTMFNKDLTRAEHWIMEDEKSETDIRGRRAFGTSIKEVTVNRLHRLHAKGRDAQISLPLFVRLTISLNHEPENLVVLPPLDDSIRDKLMLFRVYKRHDFDADGPEENKRFNEALRREIPAFAWWLIHEWEIAPELKDVRFGVKEYGDKEIIEVLDQAAPEFALLDMIDLTYFGGGRKETQSFKAAELRRELQDTASPVMFDARNILRTVQNCADYLSRLALKEPKRVVKQGTGKGRGYTWMIHPPS